MRDFKCKSRSVHNALKTGCLLLVWSVFSWLKTTTAAGMGQPARGAPSLRRKRPDQSFAAVCHSNQRRISPSRPRPCASSARSDDHLGRRGLGGCRRPLRFRPVALARAGSGKQPHYFRRYSALPGGGPSDAAAVGGNGATNGGVAGAHGIASAPPRRNLTLRLAALRATPRTRRAVRGSYQNGSTLLRTYLDRERCSRRTTTGRINT
jgi:hypothetical protein